MIFDSQNDKMKEIVVDLERYKRNEDINTRVFVAHDYILFETNTIIEDKDERGYWIRQSFQIPINVMAQLIEKLKDCPHLQKEHYNYKGYLYKDEVILFEEWHFDEKDKGRERSEILVRERGKTEWISVPKKLWSKKKFDIFKGLEGGEADV